MSFFLSLTDSKESVFEATTTTATATTTATTTTTTTTITITATMDIVPTFQA